VYERDRKNLRGGVMKIVKTNQENKYTEEEIKQLLKKMLESAEIRRDPIFGYEIVFKVPTQLYYEGASNTIGSYPKKCLLCFSSRSKITGNFKCKCGKKFSDYWEAYEHLVNCKEFKKSEKTCFIEWEAEEYLKQFLQKKGHKAL